MPTGPLRASLCSALSRVKGGESHHPRRMSCSSRLLPRRVPATAQNAPATFRPTSLKQVFAIFPKFEFIWGFPTFILRWERVTQMKIFFIVNNKLNLFLSFFSWTLRLTQQIRGLSLESYREASVPLRAPPRARVSVARAHPRRPHRASCSGRQSLLPAWVPALCQPDRSPLCTSASTPLLLCLDRSGLALRASVFRGIHSGLWCTLLCTSSSQRGRVL